MKNRIHCFPLVLVTLFFCAASTMAFANTGDATQVGRDIIVGPGEEVGEATCFGCSVRVRGHVSGDVTTFGGGIIVEDQGQIGGDLTSFGGEIRLGQQVKVGGDVTVLGGHLRRDPAASVGGDVTNMGGAGWMILIFVIPLAFIGALVALIVWFIRRLLRPSLPAAA